MRYALVLLLAGQLLGCTEDIGIDIRATSLPATVDLHVGQSIKVHEDGSTITFRKVTEDSRCPIGFMCFWAGDAGAEIAIWQFQSSATNCTLHTTLDPKIVEVGRLSVRLKHLVPYPRSDAEINPMEYVATLEIDWAREKVTGSRFPYLN
jgi:hypothetical protein